MKSFNFLVNGTLCVLSGFPLTPEFGLRLYFSRFKALCKTSEQKINSVEVPEIAFLTFFFFLPIFLMCFFLQLF